MQDMTQEDFYPRTGGTIDAQGFLTGAALDLAESWARATMAGRYETARIIEAQTNTALTVLLAGAGAALGLAAQWADKGPGLWQGALCASLYLFLLAAGVVVRCLQLRIYPAQHQVAANLVACLVEDNDLDHCRHREVLGLERRAEQARDINEARSRALNAYRLAACLTPLVGLLGFWLNR